MFPGGCNRSSGTLDTMSRGFNREERYSSSLDLRSAVGEYASEIARIPARLAVGEGRYVSGANEYQWDVSCCDAALDAEGETEE